MVDIKWILTILQGLLIVSVFAWLLWSLKTKQQQPVKHKHLKFTCPDCNGTEFLEGPHGGMATNFCCANVNCLARFNDMGPFGIDRHGRVGDSSRDLFSGPYEPSVDGSERWFSTFSKGR